MTEEKLSAESVLKKIKLRGYWEVIIRPTQFNKERLSLPECSKIVRECTVMLRGWDYPHSDTWQPHVGGIDYLESLTDWNGYKELWRMHQSGQFVHLFGCHEDWLGEEISIFGPSRYSIIKPGSVLGVIMTLFRITEIYAFASRLAQKNLFEGTAFLSITLHGMKNRKLTFFESGRFLTGDYICAIDTLAQEKNIAINELLGRGYAMALDQTIWILERFNWPSPPRAILQGDQTKFLEGRI